MTCPACHREVDAGLAECPWCGVVFSKLASRPRPDPSTSIFKVTPPESPPPSGSRGFLYLLIVVVGILIWIVFLRSKDVWRGRRPSAETPVPIEVVEGSDFDQRATLSFQPAGLAAKGSTFAVTNREASGGVYLITGEAQSRVSRWIPVVAEKTDRDVELIAITWNGRSWVGYTEGHWFDSDTDWVFTIHDANTLAVQEILPAPPHVGCLAWSGDGYWAATRKPQKYSEDLAYLYRLDDSLQVIERREPPAWGCQGLAWDGDRLWFTDLFDRSIHVLDVSGAKAEVVTSYPTTFEDLGGATWDGEQIWLTDRRSRQLLRLSPRLRLAWSGLEPSDSGSLSQTELSLLREQVRSSVPAERERARLRLRQAGHPVAYDRFDNPSPTLSSTAAEIVSLEAEVLGNSVLVSWNLYFGRTRFLGVSNDQKSERPGYLIRIEGGTLPRFVETLYEASPGNNVREKVAVAMSIGEGTYRVHCEIRGTPTGDDASGSVRSAVVEVDR